MKTMRGRILKKLKFLPNISYFRQGPVSHLGLTEKSSSQIDASAPPLKVGEINISEELTELQDEEVDVGPRVLNENDTATASSIESHEKITSTDKSEHSISLETNMELEEAKEIQKDNEDQQSLSNFQAKCPPGGNECIILYTTSLRSIRKTFEDCQTIRFLLRSFKINFDERDVSMHMVFREELWNILGGRVIPPRLFIKGRYIGGADEVVSLHEQGKLKRLLEGIPLDPSLNCSCDGCGNLRFVVCWNCNGSRKVFTEENSHEMCIKCSECNENGLVRCPICC